MIKKIFLMLMLLCSNAFAAITDGKFGLAQIFDVQYYWSGNDLHASSFIAPYDKNWSHPTLSTGQYFAFFASTVHPGEWGLGIYNSNGTRASIVHDYGDITALGNGAIFYLGSGFFGNVISTAQGYSYGSSATFTNMDTNVTSSKLSSYTFASSTPLAAGQTAAPAAPATPTPNWQMIRTNSNPVVISAITPTSYNSPSGEGSANAFDGNASTKYLNFDKKNAGVTVKLSQGRVIQKFTVTTANDFSGRDPTSYKLYGSNDGVNWTLIKADTLSLSETRYWTSPEIQTGNTTAYVYYFILFPTTKSGEGCGQNCNSMQIGEVTYYYDLNDGVTSTDTGSGGTPSNPGTTGSVCADCGPTVVSTSTSNSVSTSSSSSNTSSTSVTRPTSTGGYTDVYVGTTTVTTTTTTPVTTTTWSDGSTTTSNGTSTTTSSTTYTVNPTYGIAPIYTQNAPNTGGNSVYIKQVYAWANTQVSVTQEGNNNAVTGINNGWATVDGNGSVISTKQYGQGNIIGLKMNAWGNNVDIKQQGANGGDVNNNILMFDSYGNGNASTLQQQSNNNTASIKMVSDINTVNVTQKTGTNNVSYSIVSGNWNTVNTTQNGNDNFSLININGDNNSATVNQTGSGHSTLLNLIGNKNSVSVVQTGTGDTYSLQQTCTNPAGCSVSVIRNK